MVKLYSEENAQGMALTECLCCVFLAVVLLSYFTPCCRWKKQKPVGGSDFRILHFCRTL